MRRSLLCGCLTMALATSGCSSRPTPAGVATPPAAPPTPVVAVAPPLASPEPIPNAARYPVWGIDVSHHQNAIDWRAVATEPHLRFAYLKATQGVTLTDARFQENWKRAREAGLKVGAYHFFSFCQPGDRQAQFFLNAVPKDPDALPPVVDLEFQMNCTDHPDIDALRRNLRTFLEIVEHTVGKRPAIYVTEESFWAVLRETDLHYPLWVRAIDVVPPPWDGFPWMFWQYGDQGRVAGIEGDVDLDLYAGTNPVFAELTKAPPAAK